MLAVEVHEVFTATLQDWPGLPFNWRWVNKLVDVATSHLSLYLPLCACMIHPFCKKNVHPIPRCPASRLIYCNPSMMALVPVSNAHATSVSFRHRSGTRVRPSTVFLLDGISPPTIPLTSLLTSHFIQNPFFPIRPSSIHPCTTAESIPSRAGACFLLLVVGILRPQLRAKGGEFRNLREAGMDVRSATVWPWILFIIHTLTLTDRC